ncbi:MAG: hypothetical protein JNM95_05925 [Chitinophagaceae bacterium]|nr:hypothetical protein [Chitinophagaceae bacterium]
MKNSIVLIGSLAWYCILVVLLNPVLGYMLDSDAVAYLTVARRAANGQFMQSINGLWSPLNSWLMVPFLHKGLDAWWVAKALNAVFGGLLLVQSILFIRSFIKTTLTDGLLLISLPLITAFQVYFQLFGDVLQLLFVLGYLRLLLSEGFIFSSWKAILCGVLMGIGFYAKAYTLIFFGLHYTFSLIWFYRKTLNHKSILFRQWVLGGGSFFLCILPWSYLMFKKYHVVSLSGLAGKLNMSWYINSGKSFNADIKLLIPPPYPDSPSFWEDPWFSQSNLSTPFSSLSHFIRWVARVVYTSLETVVCIQEISFLGIALLLLSAYFLLRNKKIDFVHQASTCNLQLLLFTCLILPIGYSMMHVETRYLWLMIPILFILGFRYVSNFISDRKPRFVMMLMVAFSFLLFPCMQLKTLRYKNKDLFEKAAWLRSQHIEGKFTSNISDAGQMWVIAYLNQSNFYTIERNDYSEEELIKEMKRYGVEYYLFEAENNVLQHELPTSGHFEKVSSGYGITVYRLNYAI